MAQLREDPRDIAKLAVGERRAIAERVAADRERARIAVDADQRAPRRFDDLRIHTVTPVPRHSHNIETELRRDPVPQDRKLSDIKREDPIARR